MDFEVINAQLRKLNTARSIEDAQDLINLLMRPLGVGECDTGKLLNHTSIQREISRFVKAPGFRNQAAAYVLPHDTAHPLDLKLFWLKKTTKANLSWLVALTPNYEDSPENNPNANIGIDFVLSEECDRLFIVLSQNLKLRVLELHETLSHTQREILGNWASFSGKLDQQSETYKEQLQKHLWKSFDYEQTNREFYQKLVTQFDVLVSHLKKQKINEEEAKMFSVRLIGRTLFLWFLRKKEFINPDIKYFETSGSEDQTKFYREKLEPLFFDVLNTDPKNRTYADTITPFLNGGLFEPIATDFYKDTKLTFPDGFFSQFFGILNHYNFTVDEGTSEYEHVAVDPEMLGRVFENLLASINPGTETNARKAQGAFYTPRTIVDYMCEQSLIEYLKTKLPETANRDRRVTEIVTMSEPEFREQDHNKRRDWKKDLGQKEVIDVLNELRILDPAVGSGAFPMGMLTLLIKVYTRIDTTKEKELSQLKRDILSRSLYGVDIDQMAIQICRLRAWLSILVDMESLKKVEPLPNLDFKFVCANTLIPLAEGTQDNLFDQHQLKEELIALREQYYEANKKTDKKKLSDQYLAKIRDGGLFAALESERQRQLKDYNPFDSLNSSSFYDPSLMHGVENFDVAIGNPPYIRASKIDKSLKHIYKLRYRTSFGSYDIYSLFFEKVFGLLKKQGIYCFITSNKFLIADYAKPLRQLMLSEARLLKLLDLADCNRVFESALVSPIVTIGRNEVCIEPSVEVAILKDDDVSNISSVEFFSTRKPFSIHLIDEHTSALMNKIRNNSLEFEKIADIRTGVMGFDYWSLEPFVYEGHKAGCIRLVTNGFMDRYKFSWGQKGRLYKKDFLEPYLDIKNVDLNSSTKELFLNKKIIIRGVAQRLTANIDNEGFGLLVAVHSSILLDQDVYDPKFIVGLLNSSLLNWVHLKEFYSARIPEGSLKYPISFIKKIPIYRAEKHQQKNIIAAVNKIYSNKYEDITNLTNEIDELVMDLYDLTSEEKEIIRNS